MTEQCRTDSDAVLIRKARIADSPALARLMADEITWGLMRHLGIPFVTLLHEHMIQSQFCLCLVCEQHGSVLGYIALGVDPSRFHRQFILRHGWRAALLVLPRMFRWRNLRVVIRGLTYFEGKQPDKTGPELISLVVDSRTQGRGIGTRLCNAMLREVTRSGIETIRIGTVATNNAPAIALYEKVGFRRVGTERFYSDTQVHVYSWNQANCSDLSQASSAQDHGRIEPIH